MPADTKLSSKEVQIIPVAANQVVLKKGITELSIQGAHVEKLIETVFQMLDGTLTGEQIIASFPEQFQSEVKSLLTLLQRHRLIDNADNFPQNDLETFFWNFDKDFTRIANTLKEAYVLIAGVGLISQTLAQGLLDSGIGSVTVVDDPALRNLDFFADSRLKDEWRLPLAAYADKGKLLFLDKLPEGVLLKNYACLAVTSDFGDAAAIDHYNQLAHQLEFPMLPVVFSDLVGTVGPLIVPNETPCWECVHLRRESTDNHADVNKHLRTWVSEHPQQQHLFPSLSPMARILGNIAAIEVVKFIGRFRPTFNVGKLLTVNLIGTEIKERKVLRVPRCPVCSSMNSCSSTPIDIRLFLPGKEE